MAFLIEAIAKIVNVEPFKGLSVVIILVSIILLLLILNESWVKASAEQYTKALLNSIDNG